VLFVAIVSIDGSEIVWEPGSAMVPTFCADGPKPRKSNPEDAALGKAKAGDGDLPLAEGEGGGDPNRESPSSIQSRNTKNIIQTTHHTLFVIFCLFIKRYYLNIVLDCQVLKNSKSAV